MEEILVWFESNLLRVGLICGAITAVSTVIYFLFKHGVKQPLERHITDTVTTVVIERTKNIETDANGGQSLNDIGKRQFEMKEIVKDLGEKIDDNHEYVTWKISKMEDRQLEIYQHIFQVQETQIKEIKEEAKRRKAKEKENDELQP